MMGLHPEDLCMKKTLDQMKALCVQNNISLPQRAVMSDDEEHNEEEVEFSTRSIQIEESLLEVTHYHAALEVYEISNISSPHMDDLEEDIRISVIE